MTFRILVVCSANMCRSPLAAASLARSMASSGLERRVTVTSGGVEVPLGRMVCPDIVRLAESQGLRSLELPRHVTHQVTPAQLEQADLLLATDRRVRSSMVKLAPSAAGRMFTLREAAELGPQAATEQRGRNLDERLPSFVAAMNANRGLSELPRTRYVVPLPTPWRRVAVHAHDIPDAHQADRAPHRVVYKLTVAAARQVAQDLGAGSYAGGQVKPWT